ncbi:MAG: hypothetical protein KBG28_19940 [Kofleriaceae bacterium]|nr:hypothetical protein [Kofleriaceae bacterium]MBP6838454.1 hypothetical protein [Kofleriaceae bacterium]MBP9206254.1 hypothetical protein [Kofleriaceae bacterium]
MRLPLVLGATSVVVATLTVSQAPVRAEADGLTDALGPRELAVGDALRAGAIGASAALLNPAALTLTREMVFEGGYGYRGTDAASVFALAACDSTNALPGCFYYNYLSASPEVGGMTLSRRAHTAGYTMARAISPRVSIGTGVKYFNVKSDMADEGDAKGVTFDAGAAFTLTDSVNLGVVGYNLYGADAAQFPRAVAVGGLFRPMPKLTASFDALWNLDRDADQLRYGGGLEYFIATQRGQAGYPLRAGAVHDAGQDATYISGGLGMATMKFGVDVGARRQIGSGDELVVTAGLRFYGPRMATDSPGAGF